MHPRDRLIDCRSALFAAFCGICILGPAATAECDDEQPLRSTIQVAIESQDGLKSAGANSASTEDQADERLAKLIQQLGNPQYAQRQRAQDEIIKLGFAAFDALSAAEDHEDPEIATRAHYLVNLIDIKWAHEGDSAPIKAVLANYDGLSAEKRMFLMRHILKLPQDDGLGVLCRLIRFERSQLASKHGALLILASTPPRSLDAAALERRYKIILDGVSQSSRPAARWLRSFVRLQSDPAATIADWETYLREETALIDQSPAASHPNAAPELMRRQVEALSGAGRGDQANALIDKLVGLEKGDSEKLINMLDWLVARRAWPQLDSLVKRFEKNIRSDALLQYHLADVRKKQGNAKLAEELAQAAFAIESDQPLAHLSVAAKLQTQGFFDWAEREYRFVFQKSPDDSRPGLTARLTLAELLHDLDRDKDAHQIMQAVVELMDSDNTVVQALAALQREPGAIRSRMHFFAACSLAATDRKKQAEQLMLGLKADPQDADVLIALYRLPGQTAEEKQRTRDLIKLAADAYRVEIEKDNTQANPLNQFAWLVGNTEGDFDEAIQMSHRSLELAPGAGSYLDTLAHCYFGKGDYENAVKYQAQAVEVEPHTHQIARALDQFREARAKAARESAAARGIQASPDR